ncbi:MAG: hypothetical protein FJ148_27370 [Deltaproteobacteria bacterium]|nr:hypothetical protein [Deltaproteobacteria bacterium]
MNDSSGSGAPRSLLLLLCAAALAPRPAAAFEILTRDKDARFVHDESGGGWSHVRVGADRALRELEDPRCPAVSKIRVSSYKDNRVVGEPLAELPCSEWRKIPDGFLYSDPAGSVAGIEKVRYTTRGLEVHAAAPGPTPIVGPVGFTQLNLEIDGRRFIARFHDFTRNDDVSVVAKRPSRAAADGEAAFWDTLLGNANRDLESLELLGRATQQNPRDGRSHFLTGMMHLQRSERTDTDPRHMSAAGRLELLRAVQAFDRATPLLWDGVRGDSRVPGFASAALYKKGVAYGEPDTTARGFQAMSDAADVNPLFNGFIPFGAGPIAPPDSDEYALILHLLDDVFPTVFADCVGQNEICFNGGLAPHNLEGTFVLSGDLYTKAGRIAEAQRFYENAADAGEISGWNPRFVARARELAATAPERADLYGNDDPDDDPPFTDFGGAGNCAYCHNQ